jgi:hypothetical protein
MITFYGRDQQWVKSCFASGSFADKPVQLPPSTLLCERMEQNPGKVLQIADMGLDEGFGPSPMLQGAGKLRFYAAMPIYSLAGEILGALAVLDRRARSLAPERCLALETLRTR